MPELILYDAALNIGLHTPIILALFSVTFCSLYGISDQWHQSFVEGLSADVADWMADTVDASLVML